MAHDEEDLSDLFAIPDFWRPCNWLDKTIRDINKQNPIFEFDGAAPPRGLIATFESQELQPLDLNVDLNIDEDDIFFKLPPILKELAAQQPRPSPPHSDDGALDADYEIDDTTEDEDFWLLPEQVKKPEYKTWEAFEKIHDGPFSPMFISEAGPSVFDALVTNKKDPNDDRGEILDNASYCACLLTLALGRSSLLFAWDQSRNSFVKTTPRLRTSGVTLDLVRALDKQCLDCGNCIRHLQYFSESTYATPSTPTRIALAGVIDRLVTSVRSELSVRSQNVRSIVQLQAIVRPVQSVLSYFKNLVKKVAPQKTDEAMLSCLFEEVQAAEYRNSLLRTATREVLRIVSRPWIEFVEEWIGVRNEHGIPITKKGSGKGFVKVADNMWIDDQGFELEEADYFLDQTKVPTFLPEDLIQAIFETGRNIRFLREHHPEHALSRPDIVELSTPPKLEWQFEWEHISKIEARVKEYRDSVASALNGARKTNNDLPQPFPSPRTDTVSDLSIFGKPPDEIANSILNSIQQLSQAPKRTVIPNDELESFASLLRSNLYNPGDKDSANTPLDPHSSLIPFLSFNPLIMTQSTIINKACMTLLFTHHNLRLHLDLLHQYFLLSNGLFVSRLSHALFDPEVSTAERKQGVALTGGTMGLRMGGRRKAWPPASSELRLVLMGVLVDSYNTKAKRSLSGDLGDILSFAVRGDLTQEEIDKCMNPDGLEALDFLRLAYVTPKGLASVIGPGTMKKYDRVWGVLLRCLRMGWVVDDLFRLTCTGLKEDRSTTGILRFVREARHFVTVIMGHFFEVGVEVRWNRFQQWLDEVEKDVLVGGGESVVSVDAVRDKQDQVLDEILGVLFLRKRQVPVMKLLEEVFGVVLGFSRLMRVTRAEAHLDLKGKESPEELYAVFRRKFGVFINVLKGLSDKVSAGGGGVSGKGSKGENTVEQLLIRLDIEGYYGKKG
ncbi:Spc98 family-domain-containing protein [Podospora fimiseda]|uniref:Spindle pole body component n=1 Tax=Podospora fimiseda TaxID=252190 RepID=A0AAN7BXP1_9PEZI|nr:Spc98 family-domain-containing protein [Podospora fimiseda]